MLPRWAWMDNYGNYTYVCIRRLLTKLYTAFVLVYTIHMQLLKIIERNIRRCLYMYTCLYIYEVVVPSYSFICYKYFPDTLKTLFPLLMCCWFCVQMLGYIMVCGSCSFFCTLHYLIIITMQTIRVALNFKYACWACVVECVFKII